MKLTWPIFMPGYSVIGRLATLASSSVMWPSKPASTKPAVEWISSPSLDRDSTCPRPARPGRRVRPSRSRVDPSTNSPGWRMNGSSPTPTSSIGTSTSSVRSRPDPVFTSIMPAVWLRNTRKRLRDPHVDRRRLDQRLVERLDHDAPGVELLAQRAVGQDHGAITPRHVTAAGAARPQRRCRAGRRTRLDLHRVAANSLTIETDAGRSPPPDPATSPSRRPLPCRAN